MEENKSENSKNNFKEIGFYIKVVMLLLFITFLYFLVLNFFTFVMGLF